VFFKGRNLLSLSDLTDAEISEIVAFAHELKGRFHAGEPMDFLSGAQLFVMDPEGLLGAWNPLALAMTQLGGKVMTIDTENLRDKLGETWFDRLRLLELSGHGLASAGLNESNGQSFLEDLGGEIKIPLINAMSDLAAPMQALATQLTLTELLADKLEDARVAMVWAPPGQAEKPLSHPISLAEILLRRGLPIRMACPVRFHPGADAAEYLDAILPGGFELSEDPAEALDGADVVFSMNWTPDATSSDLDELATIGSEYAPWKMVPELFAMASDKALLGGGLPQSRDNEIAAELLESPRSIHLEESANLLHVAKAVLALYLDPVVQGSPQDNHDSTVQ
jgi:ornithine carbamoyltransferase